jgi:hypothetical protein
VHFCWAAGRPSGVVVRSSASSWRSNVFCVFRTRTLSSPGDLQLGKRASVVFRHAETTNRQAPFTTPSVSHTGSPSVQRTRRGFAAGRFGVSPSNCT